MRKSCPLMPDSLRHVRRDTETSQFADQAARITVGAVGTIARHDRQRGNSHHGRRPVEAGRLIDEAPMNARVLEDLNVDLGLVGGGREARYPA